MPGSDGQENVYLVLIKASSETRRVYSVARNRLGFQGCDQRPLKIVYTRQLLGEVMFLCTQDKVKYPVVWNQDEDFDTDDKYILTCLFCRHYILLICLFIPGKYLIIFFLQHKQSSRWCQDNFINYKGRKLSIAQIYIVALQCTFLSLDIVIVFIHRA